jgi:hypothetical protein
MRQMEIPPFRDEITISDLENLYKHRLSKTVVLWPNQAIPLLGYMCWPNDPAARDQLTLALRNWANGSQLVPPRLGRIQHEWLRIADILHDHYDLHHGQHQRRRGGPSLGKAITLVAATARSRGTRPANLWKLWEKYKDVAHLVTAAALVCADVRTRLGNEQIGPFGLSRDQFLPFQTTMLLPDLVVAVGLEFERHGLNLVPYSRSEPTFDPETLWRMPPGIKVAPVAPPARSITAQDFVVLASRRAGNRGKANRRESMPVFDSARPEERETQMVGGGEVPTLPTPTGEK